MFFCYRWALINFKRDIPFDDVLCLWEILWSNPLTPHFILFIIIAILQTMKEDIQKMTSFDEMLMEMNEISGKFEVREIASSAEGLFYQISQSENIPQELKMFLAPPPF